MVRLMLATGNAGKIAEMRSLLALYVDSAQVTVLTPQDWLDPLPEVLETGATFAENARLKASALAKATGIFALADDSGLCVDALDGGPGLYSARWAGNDAADSDRNARLLAALDGIPPEDRTARFVCALALAAPSGTFLEAEGICEGWILTVPRGESGFGYDPLFFMPELNRTMAELTVADKNRSSHRAIAMANLTPNLCAFLRLPV